MAALCGMHLGSCGFLGTRVAWSSGTAPSRASVVFRGPIAGYGNVPKIGPGKKWEHAELTKNGKAVRIKMHVKNGDLVQVTAGSDKGKVAKVTRVLTKRGEVVVEGVNIKTKHMKPVKEGEQGQIVQKEFPIHHSNVMLYSQEKGVRSRVGHKLVEGKKVRYLVKTGELLE